MMTHAILSTLPSQIPPDAMPSQMPLGIHPALVGLGVGHGHGRPAFVGIPSELVGLGCSSSSSSFGAQSDEAQSDELTACANAGPERSPASALVEPGPDD
eukprot:scaffold53499_cov18-Tisochrysis_lutea.AAC.2